MGDLGAAGMQSATIKTMIRCRPLPDGKKPVVNEDRSRANTLKINHPTRNVEQEFQFDELFDGDTSQEKVFDEACKPLVDHVLDGYNSCCFAYGQTGSGKTHTMFGPESVLSDWSCAAKEDHGLALRAIYELFDGMPGDDPCMVTCSYVEVHNDACHDLLGQQRAPPDQVAQGEGGHGRLHHGPARPRHLQQ